MGADDGNRTRMTSLEGSGYGSAEQRKRRSGAVSRCPWMTVNHLGSPSGRVRRGPLPGAGDHQHPARPAGYLTDSAGLTGKDPAGPAQAGASFLVHAGEDFE